MAQNENNHFGIKATPEWIAEGGRYSLYSDDKPNEKFCSYDSVGDSYEHHSRFLKENNRYARCFSLSPDDYKGWTLGLEKAGYATGGHYADSLQRIIEQNGLQKYDRQVMQEMEAQGKRFGVEENPLREAGNAVDYSFPVERKEFLFVTSPFGMRQDTKDGCILFSAISDHESVDISPTLSPVLNAKIIPSSINVGWSSIMNCSIKSSSSLEKTNSLSDL